MKKLVSLLVVFVLILGVSAMAMAEKLVVGATPTPHAEILELIKDDLAEKGVELEIIVYTEYTTPNMALSAGDLDANYFQHAPYMEAYNESVADDQKLIAAIGVHYEPYALYPGKTKTLEELQDGATITVTNDPSNEARALMLLESAGLIVLREDAGLAATVADIAENPKGLNIVEIEAAQLPRTLPDVDMAVINGNFALDAGLNPTRDSVFIEPADGEAGKTYTNYVVVRAADADADWVQTLREVICSQKVYDFILNNEDYKGGVIPAFTVE
jgi:D-methionine transport system substrate-binding protein